MIIQMKIMIKIIKKMKRMRMNVIQNNEQYNHDLILKLKLINGEARSCLVSALLRGSN